MKTKSKSVKRKIIIEADLERDMMGVPKKPNVGPVHTFDYTPTHLYGEGSSSDKYGKAPGPAHIHTHVHDVSAYSPITAPSLRMDASNNHISACTWPNAQTNSSANLIPTTTDTLTSNQNLNLTTTNPHSSNETNSNKP